MGRDQEEPNRVLGIPIRPRQPASQGHHPQLPAGIPPRPGPASQREEPGRRGARARDGEEPQRVLGFPVDWFGPADRGLLTRLARPIREFRHRARRRPPSP